MNNKTIGQGFLHTMLDAEYKKQNRIPPKWLNDYMEQDSKVSCFFGSHLLNKYPNNPIALVEAPKTAIYGTIYFGFPENPANYLFLAVYNYSSLNAQKFQELSGRNVTLFPDLSINGNAYKGWSEKKHHFEMLYPGTKIQVSDILEKNANQTDRKNGLDLADYLIRLDWREFIQK